jgi:hypothetical protein
VVNDLIRVKKQDLLLCLFLSFNSDGVARKSGVGLPGSFSLRLQPITVGSFDTGQNLSCSQKSSRESFLNNILQRKTFPERRLGKEFSANIIV